MAGELSLLTPITSPMVTRPTSPTAAAAANKRALLDELPTEFPTDPTAAPAAAASAVAATEEGLLAAGALLACNSSTGISTGDQISASHSAASPARPKKWRSPPCCDGCGAAKASGGQCTGCGGRFCTACMGCPAPTGSTTDAGVTGLSPGSSSNGSGASSGGAAHGAKEPCNNCSSLCISCKPVACCFCEELRQQPGALRLCEACAVVCDACQKAACSLCRAEFGCCSSCGYAACEDCRLQLQLQVGAPGSTAGGSFVGPSGAISCWCAPPLRMASNVRHVSSQRFQMAQLHPSFLACTMEAAGLRDADYDEDISYEEDDVIMGHMAADTEVDPEEQEHHQDGSSSSALGHKPISQGLPVVLSAKTLEAAIGSLPGYGGHLNMPLSPSSSTHSSAGHYVAAGGHLGSGLAGVLGYSGGVGLRHPEATLKGWLDGGH